MGETQVKGTALHSTVRFIQEKYGPEGLEKATSALPEAERTAIRNGVLVSSWYPFKTLIGLMRGAQAVDGGKTADLFQQMGRASADFSLNTVYKIFFRVGSPQFIISRAAVVYTSYYSVGELKVPVSEKGRAAAELHGFPEATPEFCSRLLGWMQRTLELTGAENVVTTHTKCVTRGDSTCRWDGTWKS